MVFLPNESQTNKRMILDLGTLGTLLGELLERFGRSSSHQNDDDDDDEHDNAQKNDQDDGHTDAPRLLSLSLPLSQNTLTLLCAHEVALHGAGVGGDHAGICRWEDTLLQTLSLANSDGDDRAGCSTLILAIHCEWDAIGGVGGDVVDLTRLLVQHESLRVPQAAPHPHPSTSA